MRRLLTLPLLLFFLLAVAPATFAQLVQTGNEQVFSFSSPTVNILSNIPVSNLLTSTGTNEFILSTQAAVNSIANVYITNDTGNPCNNLKITLGSTGAANLNSFNQSPGFWQPVGIIPTQATASGFVSSNGAITLPANSTVRVSSLPIASNRFIIFLPLSSGCPTTNIDLNVVFTQPIPATGLSSSKTGVGNIPPLAAVSDIYTTAFANSIQASSPAGSVEIAGLHNATTTTKNIYFDRVVISTTSTTPISLTLQNTSNVGTTCTVSIISSSNGLNLNVSNPSIAQSVAGACGTNPSSTAFLSRGFSVSNSAPVVLDLKGVIAPSNTTNGLDVINTATAVTGTVTVDYYWYEL